MVEGGDIKAGGDGDAGGDGGGHSERQMVYRPLAKSA